MNLLYKEIFEDLFSANSNIEKIASSEFPASIIIQPNREHSEVARKQIETALKIRESFGFSFWESMMATFINSEETDAIYFKKILHHNPLITTKTFKTNSIGNIIEYLEENDHNNVALLSRVWTTNSISQHIPMIDFHINVAEKNQKIVELVLKSLELDSGYLINSGKSYHFISVKLISEEGLINLLSKMILFCPIIDRNWIVHQLLERQCALRITKGNKVEPQLVKKII